MSTKKTSPAKNPVLIKTFGQLNLGDRIFQVSHKGIEEVFIKAISEESEPITEHIIITVGNTKMKVRRNDISDLYHSGYSFDREVFISTSKAKAGTYLHCIKSSLMEAARKNVAHFAKQMESSVATLKSLEK